MAEARWGEPETVEVPAGRHRVTVSFPYLGRQRTGAASIDLAPGDGQVADLTYRSPWTVTDEGSFTTS